MATPAIAQARLAGVPWSLAGLGVGTALAALVLPWARVGRDLAGFAPGSLGVEVAARQPAAAAAIVVAAAATVLALAPLPLYRRGRLVVAAALVGLLAAAWTVASAGAPLGPGALVLLLGLLSVLGVGLSLGGYLLADAFVATCIVWAAAFVATFIVYPLVAVLQGAVLVNGRFTLDVVRETVRSPAFLLINNPATPLEEGRAALLAGAGAALLAGIVALLARRPLRAVVLWAGGTGAGIGALVALFLGFGAVRNSVLLALVVGGLSTGLGFLFALLAERSRLPTRRLFGPISILPIITPPFVLGLAIIYLFGRRGYITHHLLGLSTTAFAGMVGVTLAQVLAYTPIAFLILQGVVRQMDAALEEAAETLGADRWHILRTVVWPLARPGVANAFLLVAIESLADFGNPIVVGGGLPYLATEIFFAATGRGVPEAAVFGVVLLALTLSLFVVQQRWVGRRSYVTVTGRPSAQGPARPLPPLLDYAVTAVFGLWLVLIVLLYGSVFVGAVTKLWGFDYTVTLEHVQGLSPTGWHVFRTTAWLSAVAAVPSTLVGFLIGYLVSRVPFPGRDALAFASMLSFATPGTVMGIGYILAFNTGVLLLTGTELIIVLAFVFRNMPVALRAGVASILQVDRSLEEASTMLRAGTATTLRRIVVPLVRGALLAGAIFSFVRAMTAISQVIFLITPRTNLATTQILSYINYGTFGLGAALSAVLVVFMAVVIVALYLAMQRWGGGSARELPAL